MDNEVTNPKVREFLPNGVKRKARTAETIAAASGTGFDFPATQVGIIGNVTIYYDPSLGQKGLSLATQMLKSVSSAYADLEAFFGVSGSAFRIVIAPLSGSNDGSGGAYHYGCDFVTGGVL